MAKAKIKCRKDSKGRVLQKGETQRKSDEMYIYTYTDPYGTRRYCYSKDLAVLREKERWLKRDQMDGLDVYAAGKATLNETFDRYMSTKYHLRNTTKANYVYNYDRYVRVGFGERKIGSIKYSDVKQFYYDLLNERNLGIATVDNIHTVLHPTFAMAVRDDIIRKNPTDGLLGEIKKQSGKNKGIRHALTVEQQKAFMDYLNSSPDFYHWVPIFTVLLGTGCRVGEAMGLRWCDVDFENRSISINHSVSYYMTLNRKSSYSVAKPKTEAGIRVVPMLDAVYNVLQQEYNRQKQEGFSTFELEGMTGFIFTNRQGNVYCAHNINAIINRICEYYNCREITKAKQENREPLILPHFSCHVLRHTFCSRLCENETNVKVIQEIMGHANIETTLDIYAEVNYSKKKESMEKLSKILDIF